MPMLGVMSETLEREGGSIKGEDDFFSVARTTPLVAREEHVRTEHFKDRAGILEDATFDSQRSDTLVDGVQGVFYLYQFTTWGECGQREGVAVSHVGSGVRRSFKEASAYLGKLQ